MGLDGFVFDLQRFDGTATEVATITGDGSLAAFMGTMSAGDIAYFNADGDQLTSTSNKN